MTTSSLDTDPSDCPKSSAIYVEPEDILVRQGVFSIDGLDGMTKEQAINAAAIALPIAQESFAQARQLGLF